MSLTAVCRKALTAALTLTISGVALPCLPATARPLSASGNNIEASAEATYDVTRTLPSGKVELVAIGVDFTEANAISALGSGIRGKIEVSVRQPLLLSDRTAEQWAPPLIGATARTRMVADGTGAVIAVLDTGVAPHPDLPHVRPGVDLSGQDEPDGRSDVYGHGTHVAGIAAAAADDGYGIDGVAPGATVLPVKVLDDQGAGSYGAVAAGVSWAAAHGADVINLSLGGLEYPNELAAAVEYAHDLGVVVVAAAGNSRNQQVVYPAALPGVVGVAATDRYDHQSWSSSWGQNVDMSAPGDSVLSTLPGGSWDTMSGTSMAAPHVAGAAALVFGQHPHWSRERVVNQLEASAKDLGDPGWDVKFGFGRLDVAAAVTSPELPTVPDDRETDKTEAWASLIMPQSVSRSDDFYELNVNSNRKEITLSCTMGSEQSTTKVATNQPFKFSTSSGRVTCSALAKGGRVLDSRTTLVKAALTDVHWSSSQSEMTVSGRSRSGAGLVLERWSKAADKWLLVDSTQAGDDWAEFQLSSKRMQVETPHRLRALGGGHFSHATPVMSEAQVPLRSDRSPMEASESVNSTTAPEGSSTTLREPIADEDHDGVSDECTTARSDVVDGLASQAPAVRARMAMVNKAKSVLSRAMKKEARALSRLAQAPTGRSSADRAKRRTAQRKLVRATKAATLAGDLKAQALTDALRTLRDATEEARDSICGIPALPPAPTGLQGGPRDGGVWVSWEPVDGASGYLLWVDGEYVGTAPLQTYRELFIPADGDEHTVSVGTFEGGVNGEPSRPIPVVAG